MAERGHKTDRRGAFLGGNKTDSLGAPFFLIIGPAFLLA